MNGNPKSALDDKIKLQMTDTERATALITLSNQMTTQYHERRNLEWRIHVSLWTLLAAGAYFIVTAGISVKPWEWLLLLALVGIVHTMWTLKMQLGEIRDQDQSIDYRKAAEAIIAAEKSQSLSIGEADDEQTRMPKWLRHKLHAWWWWNFVVLGTTAAMAAAILLVVFAGRGREGVATTQQQLQYLERQVDSLQQEERITALEMKQIRAEQDLMRQSSSVPHSVQSSNLRQP